MEEKHSNDYDPTDEYDYYEDEVPAPPPVMIGGLVHPFSRLIETPIITYTLVTIIGFIFLLQLGEQSTGAAPFDVQWPSCNDGYRLTHDFAGCGAAVIYGQEFYRMFTLMFLHGNSTHIAFNAIALYALGRDMERVYGRTRFLYIYFVGGFVGSLFSLAFRGVTEFSVGASGAIFAIAGMNLAFFYRYRNRLGDAGEQNFQGMLRMVGINLVIGLVLIRVNNLAHIGGLLGGMALGYIFAPWHVVTQIVPEITVSDQNTLIKKSGSALGIIFLLSAATAATWYFWRFVLAPI